MRGNLGDPPSEPPSVFEHTSYQGGHEWQALMHQYAKHKDGRSSALGVDWAMMLFRSIVILPHAPAPRASPWRQPVIRR